jgi:hypothetical protein
MRAAQGRKARGGDTNAARVMSMPGQNNRAIKREGAALPK